MPDESILDSVKRYLGIVPEYTHFDADLIMHINTAFSILAQLGVGPKSGFSISDNTAVWTDFVPDDPRFSMIKNYVSMETKMLFDPPQTGPTNEALNRELTKLEWRLNVLFDPKVEET